MEVFRVEQGVLRDAQRAAGGQEGRDVLHLRKRSPRQVDARDQTRPDGVHQLAQEDCRTFYVFWLSTGAREAGNSAWVGLGAREGVLN